MAPPGATGDEIPGRALLGTKTKLLRAVLSCGCEYEPLPYAEELLPELFKSLACPKAEREPLHRGVQNVRAWERIDGSRAFPSDYELIGATVDLDDAIEGLEVGTTDPWGPEGHELLWALLRLRTTPELYESLSRARIAVLAGWPVTEESRPPMAEFKRIRDEMRDQDGLEDLGSGEVDPDEDVALSRSPEPMSEMIPAVEESQRPDGWIGVIDQRGEKWWVSPNALKLNPEASLLSEEQVERIHAFKRVLAEHDRTSFDHALTNFKRDSNPEREIRLWELISRVYAAELRARPAAEADERALIYSAVLLCSFGVSDAAAAIVSSPDLQRLPGLASVISRFTHEATRPHAHTSAPLHVGADRVDESTFDGETPGMEAIFEPSYSLEWRDGELTVADHEELLLMAVDLVKRGVSGLVVRGPDGFTWTTETDDKFGYEVRRQLLSFAVGSSVAHERSLAELHSLLDERGYGIDLQKPPPLPIILESLREVRDPGIQEKLSPVGKSAVIYENAVNAAARLPNMAPTLLKLMMEWADRRGYVRWGDIPRDDLLPFATVAMSLQELGDARMATVITDFALSMEGLEPASSD
jgi:hypothetical protein